MYLQANHWGSRLFLEQILPYRQKSRIDYPDNSEKQSPEEIARVNACITPENITDVIAETAWRGALEEILKQLKQPIYSADIMAWIEEELES